MPVLPGVCPPCACPELSRAISQNQNASGDEPKARPECEDCRENGSFRPAASPCQAWKILFFPIFQQLIITVLFYHTLLRLFNHCSDEQALAEPEREAPKRHVWRKAAIRKRGEIKAHD
jgi:hypothetical protein